MTKRCKPFFSFLFAFFSQFTRIFHYLYYDFTTFDGSCRTRRPTFWLVAAPLKFRQLMNRRHKPVSNPFSIGGYVTVQVGRGGTFTENLKVRIPTYLRSSTLRMSVGWTERYGISRFT